MVLYWLRSVPMRGALRVVTNVERNAVDVKVLLDVRLSSRTAKSCGPGAPKAGAQVQAELTGFRERRR